MGELIDGLVSRFDSVSRKIFQTPVEQLSFEDKAVVSAALAVIDKHMKTRRASISGLLGEAIDSGEVDGWDLEETESGKSVGVDVPFVKLMRTVAAGKRTPDVKLLRQILEGRGIEPEKVIKPSGWNIDMPALEALIEDSGVERDAIMTPKGWAVDEAILESLVKLGMLSQEEVDAATVESPPRATVRCTFDKDIQKRLLEQMEAKEATDGDQH
jgi:hypothetical protein